jgi:hypothetical protein
MPSILERWPSASSRCRSRSSSARIARRHQADRVARRAFIRAREAEFKRQEAGLREREAALDAQVAERVAIERKKVEEEAQRKARLALGTELESSKRELVEANELLKLREQKLAEAQRAQAELIRK